MATFEIHKGVDAPVEFKGLNGQYLFICAGGLIGAFLIVVILYMSGAGQLSCLLVGAALGGGMVLLTYRLNEKYGTYGLMKALAVWRAASPPYHQPPPRAAPNPHGPCIAR